MKNKKDIVVVIESPVQFFAVKSSIDKLIELGVTVDIVVPKLAGYKAITVAARNILDEYSYSYQHTKKLNTEYKIILSAYPVTGFLSVKVKYRIRYAYSILTAKPNPTLLPEYKLYFDAIIVHSSKELEQMSAYAQTFSVSPMKYDGFVKNKPQRTNNQKPILLYMPTYGDISSADLAGAMIRELKKDFHVICRIHAATAHKIGTEEAKRLAVITEVADEVCDDMTPVMKWMEIADVVLSDNSGSIYEALYTKTPVAVFAKDIMSRKFGIIVPLHVQLIEEGVIPYSRQLRDLRGIVNKAMTSNVQKKQRAARETHLNITGDGVNNFVDIIYTYLHDEVDQERWWLHQNLADEYNKLRIENYDIKTAYATITIDNQKITKANSRIGHRAVAMLYRAYDRLRGKDAE